MKIYNTLTRKKEEFQTIEPNKVRMYVCGPTAYNYIHIGNARPFTAFDVARRYMEYKGYEVNFVQNFTDIDDKIINKAREENVPINAVTEKYIAEAFKDFESLNIKKATRHPRATETIDEIISIISTLLEKNFAYEKNGTVFFRSAAFKEYGKLSRKNIEDLMEGARVEADGQKENKADFVLWKPKKEGEPFWRSPWSDGRPGWHIECSAMAKKYLGDTIDIHAGGEDLIFPHHENEIAQSEAANGKPFARYWMHNGFITRDSKKMAKSEGNFFTVREILEKFSGDEIRMFLLSAHYRSPINFSEDLMRQSAASLERLRNCAENLERLIENANTKNAKTENAGEPTEDADAFVKSFERAMDDDFNSAEALGSVFELVRFINLNSNENSSKTYLNYLFATLNKLCGVLGINIARKKENSDSKEIEELIEKRNRARAEKNYAESDRIRGELGKMGVTLKDSPTGVTWFINK